MAKTKTYNIPLIPKCLLIMVFLTPCFNLSHANMREFSTTRLHSTAGAGVASILMDEATILNPAPLAFFNISSIYLQKDSPSFDFNESVINPNFNDPSLWGVFISDAKGSLKGSFSYQKHRHHEIERRRYAISVASPLGKQSAFGITYRNTKDVDQFNNTEDSFTQFTVGVLHAISSSFSMGLVIHDPLKSRKKQSSTVFGLQYVFKEFISLMLDISSNIFEELGETAGIRSAVQFKLFSDFYARFGFFNDKATRSTGSGVGINWVQPKLSIGASLKNSRFDKDDSLNQFYEKVRELSFSLSYRF